MNAHIEGPAAHRLSHRLSRHLSHRLSARHSHRKSQHRLRQLALAILASVAGAAAPGVGLAQDIAPRAASDPDARILFDIAAQPLSSAMTEFAQQAGARVLFPFDAFARLPAPSLRGPFTRAEALTLLLAASGYRAHVGADGDISISKPGGFAPTGWSPPTAEDGAPNAPDAAPSPATVPTSPPASVPAPTSASQPGSAAEDDSVVITGSRIRGAPPTGANVITIDRRQIEDGGRATLPDVLQTLPQNFLGSQNETTQLNSRDSGNNVAFGSTVNLRGLGADATLTLLNGHRLAPAGFGTFVDISAVPLVAVDRVEILADGASSTYGTDAVGGVVNMILRRDFDGAETRVRYGGATAGQFENVGVSQAMGRSWARGSVLGAYDFTQRAALAAVDRPFTADTDLRPFGGANFSSPNANPGNITKIGSTSVTLAIPQGQDGTALTAASLLSGHTNFQNGNLNADLMPAEKQHSLFGSMRLEPNARLDLFADIVASRREANSRDAQLGATITVPQTNAYRLLDNLFPGQGALTMRYSFADDLGPIRYETSADTIFANAGVGFKFGATWRAEASIDRAWHRDINDASNIFDATSVAAPLASSNLATAFNPFGDGSHTSAGVLAHLTLKQHTHNASNLTAYSLKADGVVLQAPGGAIRAAFGAERRDEDFSITRIETSAAGIAAVSPTFRPGRREVDAAFGEIFVPIVGSDNRRPLLERLEMTASARFERSSDYGDTTNPKIGALWSPAPGFALRATYGTSFKAPQFRQTLGGIVGTLATATPAQDPQATNGSTGVLILLGANPSLRPETANTWTAGFTVKPSWLDGLSLDATYFSIDFQNRIDTPGSVLQAIAAPQNYAGVLIRNPSAAQIAAYMALPQTFTGVMPADGIELIFDGRLTNLARLQMHGLDASLHYQRDSALGKWDAQIGASYLFNYDRQANVASLPVDLVDTVGNPIALRVHGGLGLRRAAWRAALGISYAGPYRDNLSVPNRKIDALTTFDARISHSWDQTAAPPLRGVEIALSAINLTDKDPPFVNSAIGIGFDSTNATAQGRVLGFELNRHW